MWRERPADRVAVYTCVTDGYNDLQPHPEIPGVDWIAFIDGHVDCPLNGWELRTLAPNEEHPRRVAKRPKLLPHIYLGSYERTIWIDGTVRVDSPDFVAGALGSINSSGLALWRHPERDDLYDEASVSLHFPKYAREPIIEQAAYYHDQGYPEHAGLWACGILARDVRARGLTSFCELWQDEVDAWSVQDQLSFAYARWSVGLVPGEFPASLYSNPWLTITGHDPTR